MLSRPYIFTIYLIGSHIHPRSKHQRAKRVSQLPIDRRRCRRCCWCLQSDSIATGAVLSLTWRLVECSTYALTWLFAPCSHNQQSWRCNVNVLSTCVRRQRTTTTLLSLSKWWSSQWPQWSIEGWMACDFVCVCILLPTDLLLWLWSVSALPCHQYALHMHIHIQMKVHIYR